MYSSSSYLKLGLVEICNPCGCIFILNQVDNCTLQTSVPNSLNNNFEKKPRKVQKML